jgi:hypothetical protein
MGDLAIGGLGAYFVQTNFRFRFFLEELNALQVGGIYLVITLLYFFRNNLMSLPGIMVYGSYVFDVCWLTIIQYNALIIGGDGGFGKNKLASEFGNIIRSLHAPSEGILVVDNAFRLFSLFL